MSEMDRMRGETLESLVYVSSSVGMMNFGEISELVDKAQENNAANAITGVLLYADGNFMQYLEGPESQLSKLYGKIESDPRHTGLILLSRETIDERQFGDWTMGFQTSEIEGFVGGSQERRLIETILELPSVNPGPARIALHGFWRRQVSK